MSRYLLSCCPQLFAWLSGLPRSDHSLLPAAVAIAAIDRAAARTELA